MRSQVHPGDLPQEERRTSVIQDVASFEEIKQAAEIVSKMCTKSLRVPGWATFGKLLTPLRCVTPSVLVLSRCGEADICMKIADQTKR